MFARRKKSSCECYDDENENANRMNKKRRKMVVNGDDDDDDNEQAISKVSFLGCLSSSQGSPEESCTLRLLKLHNYLLRCIQNVQSIIITYAINNSTEEKMYFMGLSTSLICSYVLGWCGVVCA